MEFSANVRLFLTFFFRYNARRQTQKTERTNITYSTNASPTAGPHLRHESGYEQSVLNSRRRHASVPTTQ